MPLEAPIVATPGTVLVQLPPGVLLCVIVAPTHNAVGPVITGRGMIPIVALPLIVRLQPAVLVAFTVYMPAAVCNPKSNIPPVPISVVPPVVPLYNW